MTFKTLADAVEQYLQAKRLKGKKTVGEDESLLKRRFIPFFGAETKVSEITAARIEQYRQKIGTELHPTRGRPVTPATLNRHMALLRHLLRYCKRLGYLREVPSIEMAREPEGRRRCLTREEVVRLLDACRVSKNPYLEDMVTVALHTGMRRGEILGLEWERVDFARCVLVLEQTKTGKRREVPMTQTVYTVLSALRRDQRQGGADPEGYVFRKANGAAWGAITTAFTVALKKAGITDFRFHDLRHTAASWLVMEGATLMEVKEILGHGDLSMTLRYAHLAPGHLRTAISRLDGVFGTTSVSDDSATDSKVIDASPVSA